MKVKFKDNNQLVLSHKGAYAIFFTICFFIASLFLFYYSRSTEFNCYKSNSYCEIKQKVLFIPYTKSLKLNDIKKADAQTQEKNKKVYTGRNSYHWGTKFVYNVVLYTKDNKIINLTDPNIEDHDSDQVVIANKINSFLTDNTQVDLYVKDEGNSFLFYAGIICLLIAIILYLTRTSEVLWVFDKNKDSIINIKKKPFKNKATACLISSIAKIGVENLATHSTGTKDEQNIYLQTNSGEKIFILSEFSRKEDEITSIRTAIENFIGK